MENEKQPRGEGPLKRLRKKLFAKFGKKTKARDRGVIYRVKSIDEAVARATEMGATLGQGPFVVGSSTMAILVAPDGEAFGVVQRPKKAKPGAEAKKKKTKKTAKADKPEERAEKPAKTDKKHKAKGAKQAEPSEPPAKSEKGAAERGRESKPRKQKKAKRRDDDDERSAWREHGVIDAFRARLEARDDERGLASEPPRPVDAETPPEDVNRSRVAARRARPSTNEDDETDAKPRSLNMDAVKAVLRDAATLSQAAFSRPERKKR